MKSQSQGRSGRAAQKARTRLAIFNAAKALGRPTVEAAADAAGVSRATAYRYFPTQDALDIELDREEYWQDIEALVASMATLNLADRLDKLIDAVVAKVTSEERHVRQALRVYHDSWLRDSNVPNRRGGRMEWIDALLTSAPIKVRKSLRLPLALAIGPDQVVMLRDVAGLEPHQIAEVLKWSASAMLRAATEPSP